jgi:carbonic anhydrase/acetyltransferase-like protein (isoleucine patch superfamily)
MIITNKNGDKVHSPQIEKVHFIAPNAYIIGDVRIGIEVSIFFGAVLRGDIESIVVGNRTNIQEHAMLHTSHGRSPCVVGEGVTVGHRAIIHGAKVNSNCLIGMGSIILDDSEIGEFSLVGAGSLVTEGKKFPPGSLILGSPAKVVRSLTEEEIQNIIRSTNSYINLGHNLNESLHQTKK